MHNSSRDNNHGSGNAAPYYSGKENPGDTMVKNMEHKSSRSGQSDRKQSALTDILDETIEGVFVWDDNGRCSEINRSASEILGYPKDEILGKYFLDFIDNRDLAGTFLNTDTVVSENRNHFMVRVIRKDGSSLPAQLRLRLLPDNHVVAFVLDLSAQREAEEKERNLNRLYATLSEINHAIVRTKNDASLYDAVCDIAVEKGGFALAMVGLLDAEEENLSIVAWKALDDLKPAHLTVDITRPPLNRSLIGDSIRTGRVMSTNDPRALSRERFPATDHGARLFTSGACIPLQKGGEVKGVIILGRDDSIQIDRREGQLLEEIGEDVSFALESIEIEAMRDEAEKALAASEERFRTVSDFTYDWEYWADPEGKFVYVSPSCERITGFKPDDFMDDPGLFFRRIHDDDREKVKAHFKEVQSRTNGSIDFRFIDREGQMKWINHVCQPVYSKDGSWVGSRGTNRDVTDRRVAELGLQESEDKFRTVLDQMNDAAILIKDDGVFTLVSQAAEHIVGYTSAEMVGAHFMTFVHDADKEKTAAVFAGVLATGQPVRDFELRLKRKDGSVAYCEIDANIYRTGKMTGVIGVARDVSEKKKADEELRAIEAKKRDLELQLIQAQKLESLGTLAGGIAHDFNNLLGVIMGYSTMLRRKFGEDDRLNKGLESVCTAASRGASLVRQLLTIARKTEPALAPLSLNDIVTEVSGLLEETIQKSVVIESNLEDNIPDIVGDASQLHQVLMNLCVNARDAMPDGGTLYLATSVVDDGILRDRMPAAKSGRYLCLQVADTGTGMSEETKRKIFDPFFTTKMPGQGTGLGLALVYSIMEEHQGIIDVESEEGKGTVFSLFFPVDTREVEPDSTAPCMPLELPGGEETVLVIEDEEMLQDIFRGILTPKGYTVLSARDGAEGVEVFERSMDRVDLIVLDIGLPKLGGEKVAAQILSLKPDARIIVESGFIDNQIRDELSRLGVHRFIQKPYSTADVLFAVRSALDSADKS